MNAKLINLIKDYISIDSADDLKKRGLTLSDYHFLAGIVGELQRNGCSSFIQKSIADYIIKKGIDCKPKGILFEAIIKE